MKKKKAKKIKSQRDIQKSRERIENWKNIGGSLFSNQRAIDAARHNPWWAAVIIFILSVFLPLIPILSQGFTSSGSDIFKHRSYGFDITGTALVMDLKENDINLEVVEDAGKHKLVDADKSWENKYTYNTGADDVQFTYINSNTKQYDLLAFFTPVKGSDFVKMNNEIAKRRYIVGSTDRYIEPTEEELESSEAANSSEGSTSEAEPIKVYTPNYILMNPETFVLQFYKPNSVNTFTNVFGDYVAVKAGTKIKDLGNVNDLIPSLNNSNYINGVYDNWKLFIDDAFLANRNNSTMTMSLIAAGIFTVLGFFMGLMIFLLTRGKRNMFSKILNFGVTQKIQAWSMLTPSLLGMIFGFLLPAQGSIMFFIIFLGVRIMWMSMKQLRPQMR